MRQEFFLKRWTAILGSVFLLTILWPLSGVGGAAEKIRFISLSSPRVEQANFFVAQEKGYFKKEGVDFEYRPGRGSGNAMKQILAGNGDVAFVGPEAVFLAGYQGAKVTAFYNTYPQNIFEVIYHKGLGIRAVKDLRGKKIGVFSLGSGGRYNLTTLLHLNGVKESEVVLVPTFANPGPFLKRKIDAWVSITPSTWALRQKGLLKKAGSYLIKDYLNLPTDVFAATNRVLRDRRGALLSFLRAFRRGTEFMIQNPEEATAISKKYVLKMRNPQLAGGIIRMFGAVSQSDLTRKKGLGWFDMALLERAERLFRETGILKGKVDVRTHFTNALVEKL